MTSAGSRDPCGILWIVKEAGPIKTEFYSSAEKIDSNSYVLKQNVFFLTGNLVGNQD